VINALHETKQQQPQQHNAHSYDSFMSVEMPWGIVELSWLLATSNTLQETHQQWTTSDSHEPPQSLLEDDRPARHDVGPHEQHTQNQM
jgi:hypothetical protein